MTENNGIPTAQEYISKEMPWAPDREDVAEALIEFAQLHVEAALQAASEQAKGYAMSDDYLPHHSVYVHKESILNAYPKENIK